MIVAVILTFISVFLLVSAIFLSIQAAKDSPKAALRRRLRRMAISADGNALPDDVRSEIIRETPPLDRLLARVPFFDKIEKLLDQAGLKITLTIFLLFSLMLLVAGSLAMYYVTKNIWLGLLGAVAVGIFIMIFLEFKKYKRFDRFTEQLPDALAMISRSLRAGHSMVSAIELVGQETEEPICELFKTAYEQQKLGLRITDTLTNMTDRIESIDLRFFVTAVQINMDVGGNLAEILDKLGETIRERLKIRRQVRVYTAQGRLSGYVLAALPIITFFLFQALMPGYEDVLLKEKTGNYILAAAFVGQLIGFFIIRKIVNIRI